MIKKIKSAISRYSKGIVATLLLIAAVAVLLVGLQPLEQPKSQSSASLDVTDRYRTAMDNEFTKILYGAVSVKKDYKISDTAQAAPRPDQTRFGEAASPAELQWLLDEAADILEGQELFFSTDIELFPGSTVHYYMDETILAITWKQLVDKVVFTFSEVKLMHPSQFRRYLSGGEFGSGILAKTTEMSQNVNAVVACSADFYSYRRRGVTVSNGTVHKAIKGVLDLCFIDYDGNMILERGLEFEDVEAAQAYVDEHNINFSLAFGPILVKDGEFVCPRGYGLGETGEKFPRAALCQMDDLHYLFAASNIELKHYKSLTMKEFAESLYATTGCINAYALDGGQTATVVMNHELINNVNYGSERLISDMIYFATAKPEGE